MTEEVVLTATISLRPSSWCAHLDSRREGPERVGGSGRLEGRTGERGRLQALPLISIVTGGSGLHRLSVQTPPTENVDHSGCQRSELWGEWGSGLYNCDRLSALTERRVDSVSAVLSRGHHLSTEAPTRCSPHCTALTQPTPHHHLHYPIRDSLIRGVVRPSSRRPASPSRPVSSPFIRRFPSSLPSPFLLFHLPPAVRDDLLELSS